MKIPSNLPSLIAMRIRKSSNVYPRTFDASAENAIFKAFPPITITVIQWGIRTEEEPFFPANEDTLSDDQ
jgi:hypothetical protein